MSLFGNFLLVPHRPPSASDLATIMGRLLLLSLPALAAAYGPSALSPRTRHASSRSAAVHMTSATAFDLAVSKASPPQLQRAAAAASGTHMQPGRAANARASPRARELRPDSHARRRRDCSCCHPRATCAWPLRSDGTGRPPQFAIKPARACPGRTPLPRPFPPPMPTPPCFPRPTWRRSAS